MVKATKKRAGRPPALTTREIISVRLPREQVDWLKQNGTTQTIQRLVEDKMSEFEKVFLDGTKVVISGGVIAIYSADGKQQTNSNVDYYFEERGGYGCANNEEAANKYYELFHN